MPEQTLTKKQKQLIFRSWHRGTREMDFILGGFADQNVPDMDAETLNEFEELLEISDPELYNWYLKKEPVPEELNSELMQAYLAFKLQ